jgi:hypothetical protein
LNDYLKTHENQETTMTLKNGNGNDGDDENEIIVPKTPEHIQKLDKDLRIAARVMSDDEARYLVDAYYTIQEDRKRSDNQVRAMADEPHAVIKWYAEQNRILENAIKMALDVYSHNHPIASWARGIKGIGPVIAAGLIAHIDITRAPTVGHIWSYAGLDPNRKWEKGQIRPWNAQLKVLCYKIGESFCKVSGGENPSPYGVWYREQKAKYVEKNEGGGFADRCAEILQSKNWGKTTDAYAWYTGQWVRDPKYNKDLEIAIEAEKSSSDSKKEILERLLQQQRFSTPRPMLPPAHIDRMAKRWSVKLFLSHLHGYWYENHFGEKPPLPYPIQHLGHVHMIEAPASSKAA